MENVVFSEENLEIQRSVEEIKQLKAVIACRIASLQEAVHQKTELQTSLSHFASRVQKLQGEQYQLFRRNVDQQFKQKQYRRNIGKTKQEMEQSADQQALLITQIQASEKQKNSLSRTNQAKTQEQRQLCERQHMKEQKILELKNSINDTDKNIKRLQMLAQEKQHQISKLKQVYLRSLQSLQRLQEENQICRSRIQAQQKTASGKQAEVRTSQAKIEGIHHSIISIQQENSSTLTMIEEQQLRQRLLIQKKAISLQKLRGLQNLLKLNEGKIQSRKKQKEQRANKIHQARKKWMQTRQKMYLEISYSKFWLAGVQ